MITIRTDKVYYSERAGRRYFTLDTAAKAEAREMIKEKYPTENSDIGEDGSIEYQGWSWHKLKRSDVLHRRLSAIIKKKYKSINSAK